MREVEKLANELYKRTVEEIVKLTGVDERAVAKALSEAKVVNGKVFLKSPISGPRGTVEIDGTLVTESGKRSMFFLTNTIISSRIYEGLISGALLKEASKKFKPIIKSLRSIGADANYGTYDDMFLYFRVHQERWLPLVFDLMLYGPAAIKRHPRVAVLRLTFHKNIKHRVHVAYDLATGKFYVARKEVVGEPKSEVEVIDRAEFETKSPKEVVRYLEMLFDGIYESIGEISAEIATKLDVNPAKIAAALLEAEVSNGRVSFDPVTVGSYVILESGKVFDTDGTFVERVFDPKDIYKRIAIGLYNEVKERDADLLPAW